MAEISTVEEKLAEVFGLAQAAQGAIDKVEPLVENPDVTASLENMRKEAAETEARCEAIIDSRDGSKTAIREMAQETKREATEMMATYLGDEPDSLDGLEFMTMAEAGEVGHWEILGELSERTDEADLSRLAEWAIPIQERHLDEVRKGSLVLARQSVST